MSVVGPATGDEQGEELFIETINANEPSLQTRLIGYEILVTREERKQFPCVLCRAQLQFR